MITQIADADRQNSSFIRQSLKMEIDTLPEPVLTAVFEFLAFEKQRFRIADNETQAVAGKKAAYERLKKYSGTMNLEKHWKEALYEAIDEKYRDPR